MNLDLCRGSLPLFDHKVNWMSYALQAECVCVCVCLTVCMIGVYTVCAADKNVVVCKQNVCFGDNNPSGQQGV